MEENWFKNRLTQAKQSSELWTGFADAVQSLLDSAIVPVIERLANRKSLFSMGTDDLKTRMSELGKFFYISDENGASLPVLIQQRLDEIHYKGTTRPIESTLWREFKNLAAEWTPLYAPIDQTNYPYGSVFFTAEELEAAIPKYGECFLTSRGRIKVALNDVYDTFSNVNPDAVLDEFERQFKLVVEPLIPLHIVFDGMGYHLSFAIAERKITFLLTSVETAIKDGTWFFPQQHSTVSIDGLQITLSQEAAAQEINRPLETSDIRFDDYRLDAWGVDMFIAPQIKPLSAQGDWRYVVADGVATVQTLGYDGCVVEFVGGAIDTFIFPDGADSAILPITAEQAQAVKAITLREY